MIQLKSVYYILLEIQIHVSHCMIYRISKGGIYLLQENEKICEPERRAHVIEDVT